MIPRKSRPIADRVSPELVAHLWARDGGCVLAQVSPEHRCTDTYGSPIEWNGRGITVEHVKDQPRMGRRAPSDPGHTVLLCGGSNVAVPSKADRARLREWIAEKVA